MFPSYFVKESHNRVFEILRGRFLWALRLLSFTELANIKIQPHRYVFHSETTVQPCKYGTTSLSFKHL